MAEDPKITLQQPQTDKALDIKDPSNVDDTATFIYNASNNFNIDTYITSIQDIASFNSPASFPGDHNKTYAPTSSPFILQLSGTGFVSTQQFINPYLIYANIDNFIAIIPPLPDSTNFTAGNSYGYVVKSNTSIWIYFNRILFQNIWIQASPDIESYIGNDSVDKIQIESPIEKYQFISGVPQLKLYIAVNDGTISHQSNFLEQVLFKKIMVELTQSPFIITSDGSRKGNTVVPFLSIDGNSVDKYINLFGHGIEASKKVLFVKTSSNLLRNNPSAIPQNILDAASNQTSSNIQSTNAQDLTNLEFFGVGNFLKPLEIKEKTRIIGYNYLLPDGISIKNSGPKNQLPANNLSTIKSGILTLPVGNYYVIVYDETMGSYSRAPDVITITSEISGIQIQDIEPTTVILQNPTFTINGFNFPSIDDINNGAILTVMLTNISAFAESLTPLVSIRPISQTAILTIDSSSSSSDINNNGTISLISSSQIKTEFSSLNFTPVSNLQTVVYLRIEVIYPINSNKNKINDIQISDAINIQSPPVIQFLTNTDSTPNIGKSLVRVDQKTGQVISNNSATNDLFIIGTNFGDGTDLSVLIKGSQQIASLSAWTTDSSLSAIKVSVDPTNIKGDVTVEVRVGSNSSEPFIFTPPNTLFIKKTKSDAKGLLSDGEQTIISDFFEPIIPYNHFDGYQTLLNSENTKVTSSIALKLGNSKTKKTVDLSGKLELNSATAISFLPDQIILPSDTRLAQNGSVNITFNFYGIYNLNISTPKIFRLQHEDGNFEDPVFRPLEVMTVIGTGFVNGMRYNINNSGWQVVNSLFITPVPPTLYQAFKVVVPTSNGASTASVKVSNDQADSVSSTNTAGKQNGTYQVSTTVVNDKYSPLLQINQRLPAGIKMYAKGTQNTMTDRIDANMSIYGQVTPFLGSFKTLLIVIRIIVCIIDVICALINPFQLIIAIIALMDCIIDLLSLFPQLAVPIMILSFLQNFVGFLQTLITQITSYVFSIINSQLALIQAQESKDFSTLAAGEQQSFGATKQLRDAIAFLEPPLQIIQIFKDLLSFAMHFPCAGYQGTKQSQGDCPPPNMRVFMETADDQTDVEGILEKIGPIQTLIGHDLDLFGDPDALSVPGDTVTVIDGYFVVPPDPHKLDPTDLLNYTIMTQAGTTNFIGSKSGGFSGKNAGNIIQISNIPGVPAINDFVVPITMIYNDTHTLAQIFTPVSLSNDNIAAINAAGGFTFTITGPGQDKDDIDITLPLSTMFCQAVAIQTVTLQTMPGFNGLDSFGNPLPGGPLKPGSTSVVPNVTPILPDIAAAIECMTLLTDNIENALNNGQVYVKTPQQGQALLTSYAQCLQNLSDQTNTAISDICVLAISALNSELKASPKASFNRDLGDDFIKTKIPLPTTAPNDNQDAGLTLDLAQLRSLNSIPLKINTDPISGSSSAEANFGLKQDIETPIIIQTTNKSGQRQSIDTIYFNAENQDVGDLIVPGDIIEIVGGNFSGLQFPIINIQKIFTAVRLTCKLDITFEQKLIIGEQPIPNNLSGFDVKIIAHLAGNDAIAIVPANNTSLATVQIFARDHHGHEIGTGLANKVAIKIESGNAAFYSVIPSDTTDITGVIQEQGEHYIAQLKSNCTGTVIISASVCGVEFVDIGYHANDPSHVITTRKKTVKIIFIPVIDKPINIFDTTNRPQEPGTEFIN